MGDRQANAQISRMPTEMTYPPFGTEAAPTGSGISKGMATNRSGPDLANPDLGSDLAIDEFLAEPLLRVWKKNGQGDAFDMLNVDPNCVAAGFQHAHLDNDRPGSDAVSLTDEPGDAEFDDVGGDRCSSRASGQAPIASPLPLMSTTAA